jgi:outer membrane protein OmpU
MCRVGDDPPSHLSEIKSLRIAAMNRYFTKTNLLAATALSGVVLFTGNTALAQGKPAKIKLSLSGFFTSLVGFATQSSSFEKTSDADVAGTTHYDSFNMVNDAEIHVSGSTKLDNGLTVSVVVEFEANQVTANGTGGGNGIDASYMAIDGKFGQIRLGSTQPGSHDTANTAPLVGALGHDNSDTDNWIMKPANSALGTPETGIGDGKVTKIAYVSPSIAGFQLGGSYEPTGSANSWEGMPRVGGVSGTETQTYDVGIAYSGKMGKIDFSADVQYYRVQGVATASVDSLRGGASITSGPFTIGGGYRELRDEDSGVSGTANSNDEETWEIGVTYAGSGWALGLTALGSEKPLSNANAGDDKVAKYLLGASYDLTSGVELLGSIAYVDWEDELTVDSNNNSGFALVAGIAVTF